MTGETWMDVKLSEIIDVKHGFAFPGENIREEPPGEILLTPGNFAVGGGFKSDKYKYFDGQVPEEYVLHENDLIVTMTDLSKQADTLGYPALVPKPQHFRYLHNQRLGKVIIRDGAKVDKRFISYLLRTPEYRHEILASATGTTVKHTSPSRILAFKTSIPPMPEQRAIARILGTLDDKVELNRRMNETLEAMARALFRSWFVDFDTIRGKAEGRDTGLPKPLADLFPDSYEDSELGEIPKGWEVKPLSELCTLGRGASPRPINDYMNGEIPWVKIADATAAGGPFLFETKERLKTAGVGKSVTVSPGDLILSNSATCGIPMFVELHGCIHDGWLYFKNLRSISKLYLFHVLIELAEHLVHIADGSVQKNLNTELVGRQYVLVPPQAVVAAFDNQTTTLFTKMRDNGIESRTLAALRDTLLPKLISGELRIKNAARIIVEGSA